MLGPNMYLYFQGANREPPATYLGRRDIDAII